MGEVLETWCFYRVTIEGAGAADQMKMHVYSLVDDAGSCGQKLSKHEVCSPTVSCWGVFQMPWCGTVMWMSQTAVQSEYYQQVLTRHAPLTVQSRAGVTDEVAKLVERLDLDVAKAPDRHSFRYCVDAPRRESSISG